MPSRRALSLFFVLLVALAWPGLAAARARELSAGPPALAPEVEPNDTPWDATYLNGWRQGRIDPVGDVDYYLITSVYPGLDFHIDLRMPPGSPLTPVVTVVDEQNNVLANATCDGVLACLSLRLPESIYYTSYYVRVEDGQGAGGKRYEYEVRSRYTDPNEPNNFLSQATPYTPGEPLPAVIEPEGDVDTYVFTAEAGQEFYIGYTGIDMLLLDAAGQQIGLVPAYFDSLIEFDETGTYYLQTEDTSFSTFSPTYYTLHLKFVDWPILFSFTKAGTLGGVAFQPGDIVRYSPLHDTWAMHFDASDVGLRGNLVAFSGSDGLLLTYATAQYVSDVGRVRPQDVLQFYSQSLGEDTSGYFYLRMGGADVGLTTAAESIDALAGSNSGYIVDLSTKGNARLPMSVGSLTAQRDDVLSIDGDSSGQITGGTWSSTLDGLAMGIRGANLIGLSESIGQGYGYYLMYDRPVTLGGVTYQRNDVIWCAATEGNSTCDSYELAFDGALVGNNTIDALSVLYFETE